MTGLRYKFRAAYLEKLWITHKKKLILAFLALFALFLCVLWFSPHGTAPADLASRRIYDSVIKEPFTFGPVFSVSTTFLDTIGLQDVSATFFAENSIDAISTRSLIGPHTIPSLREALLSRLERLAKDSAFVAGIMDSLKNAGTPNPTLYVTSHTKNGSKSPFLYCVLADNYDIVNAGFDTIPRVHLQTIIAFRK